MDRKLPTKGVHLWALLMQHMQDCVAKHNLAQKQVADLQVPPADQSASQPPPADTSAEGSTTSLGGLGAAEGGSPAGPPLSGETVTPPLRDSAQSFQSTSATTSLKKHGIPEPDLQFLYRLFRHTIDATLQSREVSEIFALDETVKFSKLIMILVPLETNIVLYTCPLIGNMVSFPEVRERADGSTLLDIVLHCVTSYPMQRRVIHLCLMTVSNIALVQRFKLTAKQARQVALAVIPLYAEAPVVEAWSCAICNLSNVHPEVMPVFMSCSVVETLERLLLFFGDDARVVTRGLQALSNVSYGFVAGHSAAATAALADQIPV